MPDFHPVTDEATLEEVFTQDVAVLYKHSPTCPVSARARRAVSRFIQDHPEVPTYLIDVIRQRPLSQQVAETFGIRHESPQVFVLRNGEPTWYESHFSITTKALDRAIHEAAGSRVD